MKDRDSFEGKLRAIRAALDVSNSKEFIDDAAARTRQWARRLETRLHGVETDRAQQDKALARILGADDGADLLEVARDIVGERNALIAKVAELVDDRERWLDQRKARLYDEVVTAFGGEPTSGDYAEAVSMLRKVRDTLSATLARVMAEHRGCVGKCHIELSDILGIPGSEDDVLNGVRNVIRERDELRRACQSSPDFDRTTSELLSELAKEQDAVVALTKERDNLKNALASQGAEVEAAAKLVRDTRTHADEVAERCMRESEETRSRTVRGRVMSTTATHQRECPDKITMTLDIVRDRMDIGKMCAAEWVDVVLPEGE